MSGQGSDLFLSPNEQNLLVAALNSNQSGNKTANNQKRGSPQNLSSNPASGQLDFSDESPYLDFDPDGEFDDSYSYGGNRMIGDLPDLHDKRKSIDGEEEKDDDGNRKRHEGDEKGPKKPGRKPLTSEPTTKRKAQNRAAQRAFRERKEQHLKDLETKVDDLEKASEAANHENGLLKAQVERLQVELKEYRKRLSWISTNGAGRSNVPMAGAQKSTVNTSNDFQFEFPKFGDLPAMSSTNMFNNSSTPSTTQNRSSSLGSAQTRSNSLPKANNSVRSNSQGQSQRQASASQSPLTGVYTGSPKSIPQQQQQQQQQQQPQSKGSVDSLTGLFSPSILEATRQASMGGYFPQPQPNSFASSSRSLQNVFASNGVYSNSTTSNSDSPGSSSESQNAVSSMGTSPEPSLSSPTNKVQDFNLNTIDENQMSNTFDDPIPPILNQNLSNEPSLGLNSNNTFGNNLNGFNTYDMNTSWLPADASTNFDPVLFGDYREAQDNILSQDFGSFFNDAYPLPDLGSPLHNYNEVIVPEQTSSGVAPTSGKVDLIRQVDATQDGLEEVVPNTDKPMTCNKIWDRLQSMEKFRNGEIDIDNLCSELRAKAKCSEGGAVVDKKDVDKILGKTS